MVTGASHAQEGRDLGEKHAAWPRGLGRRAPDPAGPCESADTTRYRGMAVVQEGSQMYAIWTVQLQVCTVRGLAACGALGRTPAESGGQNS